VAFDADAFQRRSAPIELECKLFTVLPAWEFG